MGNLVFDDLALGWLVWSLHMFNIRRFLLLDHNISKFHDFFHTILSKYNQFQLQTVHIRLDNPMPQSLDDVEVWSYKRAWFLVCDLPCQRKSSSGPTSKSKT